MKLHPENLRVGYYARVSSDRQAEDRTIDSQVADLTQRIANDGVARDDTAAYIDDGHSGATLIRPALEKLRDDIAQGLLDRLYILSPDRLARKAAYQALLLDEFARAGVEVVFLNQPAGAGPEGELLLQIQGIIAEYERTKILERSRRGKLHAARQGCVSVLSRAPYGYRYIGVREGEGEARYQVVLEEAQAVQQIFRWVAFERVSIREVCRRLEKTGVKTPEGQPRWSTSTIGYILKNSAYQGEALFGRPRPMRSPRHRPVRGAPERRKRPPLPAAPDNEPIVVPVPALVSKEIFEAAQEQMRENQRRYRQSQKAGSKVMLQGLLVCSTCGYAWCGQGRYQKGKDPFHQGVYRCAGRIGGNRPCEREGKPLCRTKSIGISKLDELVWRDVCELLREPKRLESEYERRLQNETPDTPNRQSLQSRIGQLKRSIARLVDAYAEGLLDKEEVEPKIRSLKARLSQLQAEEKDAEREEGERSELRMAIGKIEEFIERMKEGLEKVDLATRREIIKALVKQVEMGAKEIRIVYRIKLDPFAERPYTGAQDCPKRVNDRIAYGQVSSRRVGETYS